MSQEQPSTTSMTATATPVLSTATMSTNTHTQHKLTASPSRPTHTLSPIPLHPARAGSKSPTSIPSSPTSIRSASSAIFERDIEPLVLPHLHHSHPHRTPRSTQIEQTVPSVLTEAAAALSLIENGQSGAEGISILAPQAPSPSYGLALAMTMPVSPNGQGFSSPFSGPGSTGIRTPAGIGSQSRSPSPSRATSTSISPPGPSATLRKTPVASPIPSPLVASSSLPSVPIMSHGVARQHHNNTTPPSSYSPPSMQVSPSLRASRQPLDASGYADGASAVLPSSLLHIDPSSLPPAPARQTLSATNPDSQPSKRLSFISYSDILYSNPVAALPLSSLTSSATVTPPPHLPVVTNNVPIVLPSPTGGGSSRPLSMYSMFAGPGSERTGKQSYPSQTYTADDDGGSRRHSVLTQSEDITQRLIDDLGGEWEREGFGKGLEERLEGITVPSS